MFGKPSQLLVFLAVQWLVLLIALFWLELRFVRDGILSAQAALLGIALGVARIPWTWRHIGVGLSLSLLLVTIGALVLRIDFGGWFGAPGYEPPLLLMTIRVLFLAGFYWRAFLNRGVVLLPHGEAFADNLLRFRLSLFFVLTVGIAISALLVENLDDGYGKIPMVLLLILLSLAYAALPLLSSLLALEPHLTLGKVAAYVVGILALSFGVAGFTYFQTSRWTSAQVAWLMVVADAVWLIGSLVALRCLGYRLAKESTIEEVDYARGASDLHGRSPARHGLRTSRFVILVTLSVFALWIGGDFYRARIRAHYLNLLQTTNQPVVTYAEGDASASQVVKRQIAPHVSAAYGIRNRGGTTVGPKQSAELSFLREWLGDEPISIILLDHEGMMETLHNHFPEAMIAVRP